MYHITLKDLMALDMLSKFLCIIINMVLGAFKVTYIIWNQVSGFLSVA